MWFFAELPTFSSFRYISKTTRNLEWNVRQLSAVVSSSIATFRHRLSRLAESSLPPENKMCVGCNVVWEKYYWLISVWLDDYVLERLNEWAVKEVREGASLIVYNFYTVWFITYNSLSVTAKKFRILYAAK
jgi:hypothetical protein